ncbi:MAG: serine hydrolase domain-containing protein, partial [Pseudomonadota bacterium]
MKTRTMNKLAVTMLGGLALIAPPALAGGPWEGVWDTPYGEVTLWQDGTNVYGHYDARGFIFAKTDGKRLRGIFTWQDQNTMTYLGDVDSSREDSDDGLFEWTLNGGQSAFQGQWSYGPETDDLTGNWTGKLDSRTVKGRFKGGKSDLLTATLKLGGLANNPSGNWIAEIDQSVKNALEPAGWLKDDPFQGVWRLTMNNPDIVAPTVTLTLHSSDDLSRFGIPGVSASRVVSGKMDRPGTKGSHLVWGFSNTRPDGIAELRLMWRKNMPGNDTELGFIEFGVDTKTGKILTGRTPTNVRNGINKGWFGAGSEDKIGTHFSRIRYLGNTNVQHNGKRTISALSKQLGWPMPETGRNPIAKTLYDPKAFTHDALRKRWRDAKAPIPAPLHPGIVRGQGVTRASLASLSKDQTARIDTLIGSHRQSRNLPGISVAVLQGPSVVYKNGFGFANVAQSTPATEQTVYALASVSKAIGATLAVKLEERQQLRSGKPVDLDLSKRFDSYFPNAPAHHTQTLRQIMSHQACIAHYSSETTPAISQPRGSDNAPIHFSNDSDAVAAIWDVGLVTDRDVEKDGVQPCQIGRTQSYSTGAFNILGAAKERAAGMAVDELVESEIARPHKLNSLRAMFRNGQLSQNQNRATPYGRNENSTTNLPTRHINNSWKVLGGGLEANVLDLAVFGHLVDSNEIVSRIAKEEKLYTRVNFNTNYSHGWNVVNKWTDRRAVSHGGTALGTRSLLVIYPDDDLVIAIISNVTFEGLSHTGLAAEIEDVIL